MDTYKADRTVRTFEEGTSKKELETLEAWREEVRRAGSESKTAYGDFLDSLFFYYAEVQRACEGRKVWPRQRNGYGGTASVNEDSPREEDV